MNLSLDIIFHQSVDAYSPIGSNTFLWDLSRDFILPLTLGGLAAYMIYFIFIKETKRDQANENLKRDQERSDKLIFFSVLIEGASRTCVQQKDNIKNQIRNIRTNNIDFHFMNQVPLSDLKRINELNLEDYLIPYTNFYDSNRTISIKEFKDIIACNDYFYEVFNQIKDQLQKSQSFDYERKVKFQEIFAKCYDLTGQLILYFETNDKDTYYQLQTLIETFSKHQNDNYDLAVYYHFYFIPFNEFCISYMASGKMIIEGFLDMAILTRDGKQIFNLIKSENDILKNELIGDFKNICRAIINLRNASKRILRDF